MIDRIDCDALWLYYDAAGFVYEARHNTDSHAGRIPEKSTAIPIAVKAEVAVRDGWRCRYCGLRLVSRDLIVGINGRLGDAFVVDASVERLMHPAGVTFSMPGYSASWITAEVARRQPDGSWKFVLDNPYAAPAPSP